ncbi:D-lyxose/D-mannose family sugar isomerase [Testudinibacter sp. TR-2022]|uniref:D-lyxose/D-mannose family sugar isomerase n=1 Tax=Testudinibacter sp. TR-2022 TaxID=2585029 RepID=UPI001117C371|nr:D-lyxose/D-mannose family sugar isomerase [Testudinibacter sp. TR-2022]TNH08263.1 D-lyxose/D-mannose family sugar isomerase [Pasteurellaceae bacterium Phil11]TNH24439.1 D-lyxose/D-mannose family sugar isomerase [Testudinibacter sp. TR-2022]TNH26671.1 D-lyxose/D-mannose family sugar isomerase [Testudinibacter sp. TR-2022]
MKRSEINAAIQYAKAIMIKHRFYLPKFAHYDLAEWKASSVCGRQEILQAHLGWDVTDFNLGNFTKCGLTLFTLRNQSPDNQKMYAEKIMVVQEQQITPMHYHWKKMEDIINRGGGDLMVRLYKRHPQTDLLDEEAELNVAIDGQYINLPAGGTVCLQPGQSICLPPMLYHSFWAEQGVVLAGEVSMANDDLTDNRFLEPLGRFSNIEEDEKPIHLLCSDYQQYL